MSLLQSVVRGSQTPRLLCKPKAKSTSAGQEAVELAASAGLILDEWQAYCLHEILAERVVDGKWAAFEAGVVVPRQNGKGSILEALELAALILFEERLIVHSAHHFATAREHFMRMRNLIEGTEWIADGYHRRTLTGAGNVVIEMKNGSRLLFAARERGAIRGFSIDRLVLDEAQILSESAMGALIPTLSARPNAQIIYTGSAPLADSLVLQNVRRRAVADNERSLFYAEWSCEEGVDADSPAAWAVSNPALGASWPGAITEEKIRNERAATPAAEFLRERLGVVVSADGGSGVLPAERWEACRAPGSTVVGVPRLALAVGPGMASASFAVAGPNAEGLTHIEITDARPGTGWVVETAVRAVKALGCPLIVDPRSPTAGLFTVLRQAGVELVEVSTADYVQSCAALQDGVLNGRLRHFGQGPLDVAVVGADVRPVGESWAWSQRASSIDITPLVAVTLAHGADVQAEHTVNGFVDMSAFLDDEE